MNRSDWQFGLAIFKDGLKIIDQSNFKFAFKELQRHAFQIAMNV